MIVVLDTETTGLDPRVDRVVLVGALVGDHVHTMRHDADRERIQRILDLPATFIAHNAKFDVAMLRHAGYTVPGWEHWVDTQLLAHTGGKRRGLALRELTKQLIELGELPADTLEPEDRLKAWLSQARRHATKHDQPKPQIGHAPRDLLEPYLGADLRATAAVAAHYGARIDGQLQILKLEHECLPAIAATEERGVPIDIDAAIELRNRTTLTISELRERVFELAGRRFPLGSAKQLNEVLLARGVDTSTLPRTPKTGVPSFTYQALEALDDELANTLLAYRDQHKLGKYVEGLFAHTHGDRLYGSFRQVGTRTGRMSSHAPNLQNIPASDLHVRFVIRASPGRMLVACDLDGVELRILSRYARGGALERALRDGVDLHQQTADELGVDRRTGKEVNFSIVYGAGAPRLSHKLEIEHDEARALLDRWYRLYPEVGRLKAELTKAVRQRGYLRTVGGRRHYFDEPDHRLLNVLVQGGASDLFKRAAVALHHAGVEVVLYVHDEIVAEADQDDVDRVARALEAELTRAQGPIDGLVASAAVAERWSDFKEPGWEPESTTVPSAPEPEFRPQQLQLGEEVNT